MLFPCLGFKQVVSTLDSKMVSHSVAFPSVSIVKVGDLCQEKTGMKGTTVDGSEIPNNHLG